MKTQLLSIALIASCGAAFGSPLSPEAALSRAKKASAGMLRAPATGTETLAFTEYEGPRPAIYMFSRGDGKGFLAVSADDSTAPLLGYSDSGTLPRNREELPDGMRYWLGTLAAQSNLNNGTYKTPATAVRTNIAPLTKTLWNQDAPYNDDCPSIGSQKCYTGCVATAMAQAMKYYNYPATGTGTHSYTWNYTDASGVAASKTLSFDYGSTSFDWDNMTDTYSSASKAGQNAAVAELMYACGVSVDMDYGTQESGAVSFDMVRALIENFGYDKGLEYHARDYYTLPDWEDLIYTNLSEYGPVLYGGQSNDGGHQFVCDGYRDGYFHFNWGWAGMSDGYFLLTALNPESQGIGGSTSGYNFDQDIVTKMQTAQTSTGYFQQILWDGDFTIEQTEAQLGQPITYTGSFYSFSSGTIENPTIGLLFTPANGGEPVFAAYSSFQSLQPMSGINDGTFNIYLPSSLASGQYTVQPAFKNTQGTVKTMSAPISATGSYTMTVTGSTATFSQEAPASITASGLGLASELYVGSSFKMTGTIANTSAAKEFYGPVVVVLIQNGNVVGEGQEMQIDLDGGKSMDWEYVSPVKVSSSAVTGQSVQVYLCTVSGQSLTPVSEGITAILHAASAPTLSVPQLTIADDQHLDDMTATATVACSKGYFAGSLSLVIFPEGGGSSIAVYPSDFFWISGDGAATASEKAAGNSQLEYKFSFNGEPNTNYIAAVYNGQTAVSDYVGFRTGLPSGIEAPEPTASETVKTEYFTLTGISLGTERPQGGIYIERSTHADGTVTARRAAR